MVDADPKQKWMSRK